MTRTGSEASKHDAESTDSRGGVVKCGSTSFLCLCRIVKISNCTLIAYIVTQILQLPFRLVTMQQLQVLIPWGVQGNKEKLSVKWRSRLNVREETAI